MFCVQIFFASSQCTWHAWLDASYSKRYRSHNTPGKHQFSRSSISLNITHIFGLVLVMLKTLIRVGRLAALIVLYAAWAIRQHQHICAPWQRTPLCHHILCYNNASCDAFSVGQSMQCKAQYWLSNSLYRMYKHCTFDPWPIINPAIWISAELIVISSLIVFVQILFK